MKSLCGKPVFFWVSSSEIGNFIFVRWVATRRCCGGPDTNKIDAGAIVSSPWRCSRVVRPRIDYGCKRGQMVVRPYWTLYRTFKDAWQGKRPIRKPTLEQVRAIQRRRKKK